MAFLIAVHHFYVPPTRAFCFSLLPSSVQLYQQTTSPLPQAPSSTFTSIHSSTFLSSCIFNRFPYPLRQSFSFLSIFLPAFLPPLHLSILLLYLRPCKSRNLRLSRGPMLRVGFMFLSTFHFLILNETGFLLLKTRYKISIRQRM